MSWSRAVVAVGCIGLIGTAWAQVPKPAPSGTAPKLPDVDTRPVSAEMKASLLEARVAALESLVAALEQQHTTTKTALEGRLAAAEAALAAATARLSRPPYTIQSVQVTESNTAPLSPGTQSAARRDLRLPVPDNPNLVLFVRPPTEWHTTVCDPTVHYNTFPERRGTGWYLNCKNPSDLGYSDKFQVITLPLP